MSINNLSEPTPAVDTAQIDQELAAYVEAYAGTSADDPTLGASAIELILSLEEAELKNNRDLIANVGEQDVQSNS